jgi:hypothetical protein
MLILIQTKDIQILNDNIITLPCAYRILTIKYLKIYKK